MAYKNKEDQLAAGRKHYQEHKQYYKDKAKRQREKVVQWYTDLKRRSKCKLCGMSFLDRPECCDFHHLDPAMKDENLGRIAWDGKSKALREELKKCVPLCANCHRSVHFGSVPQLAEGIGLDPIQ